MSFSTFSSAARCIFQIFSSKTFKCALLISKSQLLDRIPTVGIFCDQQQKVRYFLLLNFLQHFNQIKIKKTACKKEISLSGICSACGLTGELAPGHLCPGSRFRNIFDPAPRAPLIGRAALFFVFLGARNTEGPSNAPPTPLSNLILSYIQRIDLKDQRNLQI